MKLELLSVREAAQRRGVRLETIRVAIWAGKLRATKDEKTGAWQIPADALDDYAAQK